MEGWQFKDCRMAGASFRGSNLEDAAFIGCRGAGANFHGAILSEARFENCDFNKGSEQDLFTILR